MGLQVDEKVDLACEAFAANGATEGLAFDVLGNVVIVVAEVVTNSNRAFHLKSFFSAVFKFPRFDLFLFFLQREK